MSLPAEDVHLEEDSAQEDSPQEDVVGELRSSHGNVSFQIDGDDALQPFPDEDVDRNQSSVSFSAPGTV